MVSQVCPLPSPDGCTNEQPRGVTLFAVCAALNDGSRLVGSGYNRRGGVAAPNRQEGSGLGARGGGARGGPHRAQPVVFHRGNGAPGTCKTRPSTGETRPATGGQRPAMGLGCGMEGVACAPGRGAESRGMKLVCKRSPRTGCTRPCSGPAPVDGGGKFGEGRAIPGGSIRHQQWAAWR